MSSSESYSSEGENIPELPESPIGITPPSLNIDLSAKALYSNIKKKAIKSPSFNNSSDFGEDSNTSISKLPQESMQLIKLTDRGIEVCPGAKEYLLKVKEKVSVLSIGGPARSGKSLLMNLISGNKSFEVGSKVQACTQGIWITPLRHEEKLILLIDSEGCKSTEKNGDYDAKLFALLILISSIFVYNSKGVIDEQSINQLTLATHLSEMISFSMKDDEEDAEQRSRVAAIAPKFVWVLRDFHLSLVDQDENSITPKQYMENILNIKKFKGRNAEKNSKIREKFLEIFQDRNCVTMPRPADQEKDLEILNSLPLEALRGKFIKAFKGLRRIIVDNCPYKRFKDIELDGFQILTLLEEIVKCLNQGLIPNIHSAWSEVIRKQYERILEEAKVIYVQNRGISIEKMPFEESELIFKLQLAKDKALVGLREIQQKDISHEEYVIEEFECFYEEDLKFTLDSNTSASEAFNIALIDRIFKGIISNLNEGKYKDDFSTFENNWISGMKEYEKQARGPGKLLAITEFAKKHQHNSFSKFFQSTTEKYEDEIRDLRQKQREYQDLLHERARYDNDIVVEEHVSNMQVNKLERELGVKDNTALQKMLEDIRNNIKNSRETRTRDGKHKKKGCQCTIS